MRFSGPKLFERIDLWVLRFDPAGKRVPRERTENRYVEIAATDAGLAGVWAQLHATDGVALDQKLDALAENGLRGRSANQATTSSGRLGRIDRRTDRDALPMWFARLLGSATTPGHRRGDPCLGRAGDDQW